MVPSLENLVIRTIAMPRDTNPSGDIFGGWLLSQMDLAGGIVASQRANGRVVTVAVKEMTFHAPVFVGDDVSCYAIVKDVGRTSLTISIEVWARRRHSQDTLKVTEGEFVFVAIDEKRKPRTIAS